MRRLQVLAALLTCFTACQGARNTLIAAQPKATTTLQPVTINASTRARPPIASPLPPKAEECLDATSTISPLGRLRAAMTKTAYTQLSYNLDALLVFYSDEHLSEEPAPEERRLQYITGWDGAGTAVVMADPAEGAALWVPSSDVMRAKATVSCAWVVLDVDDYRTNIVDWILVRLNHPAKVGGDARLTSMEEWRDLNAGLSRSPHGVTLVHVPTVVDLVWAQEPEASRRRPEFNKIVANLHNQDYTGLSWSQKVANLRKEIKDLGADAMVVTALDEVAWLLNVRGKDTPYAPLLKAFVYVTMSDISVYAPQGKLSMPVRDALNVYSCYKLTNCTRIVEYTLIYADLRRAGDEKILIPAASTFHRGASEAISQSVTIHKRLYKTSPIIDLKAQKNAAEIKGMHVAHLKDAVAMCTLLSYLEGMVRQGLTEVSVGMKVDVTRGTQPGFVGVSMATRVAFGPSGAEPDYQPNPNTKFNRRIYSNSTMIIRSGGQYDEGTTIVTRTVHYGSPTRDMRTAYTSVLRSLAAMATLVIPESLPAGHTDTVVRAPLWSLGQEYPHPTGHGVGAALNRREDPVVIDYRQDTNLHPFKERYFITAEPAWYERNKYGIRLGNVLEVLPYSQSYSQKYLRFGEATLVPFEPTLINRNMLTEYEIKWLNAYNKRIHDVVGPELKSQGLIDVYYWMSNKTQAIPLASHNALPKASARVGVTCSLVGAMLVVLHL